MITDLKQFISQDYCLKCRGCCRFSQQDSLWLPTLADQEIAYLSEKGFPPALISEKKKLRGEPAQRENNFLCPFLSPEDNKCKIYDLRPFECRLYPFLLHREDKEVFLAVDLNCPFIEKNLKSNEYRRYAEYLSALLNKPDVLEILRQNLQLIQAYPEVLLVARLKL